MSLSSEYSLGPISLQSASNTPRCKRPRAVYRDNGITDSHDGLPPRPPLRPRKKPNPDTGVTGSVRRVRTVKVGVESSAAAAAAAVNGCDAERNTSNNASNVEQPVDKSELTLDLQSLAAASDLNNSLESLDNLDDHHSISECDSSNLRRSQLNASMSSLLSEQFTASWRRNCRLVKRPLNSSTQSLHGGDDDNKSSAAKPGAAVDMQKLTDSMQDLRRRVRQNQDRWRQLLNRNNLPLKQHSVNAQFSQSQPQTNMTNRRHRAFAARNVDVVATSTPRGDADALLRQLQGKLRSVSTASMLTSSTSNAGGRGDAHALSSKSDGFMCSTKPERNKPLSKLRSTHHAKGSAKPTHESQTLAPTAKASSVAVGNDISVTIYPARKPALPPKDRALERLKALHDSPTSTNTASNVKPTDSNVNDDDSNSTKDCVAAPLDLNRQSAVNDNNKLGTADSAQISKLVSHFRPASAAKLSPPVGGATVAVAEVDAVAQSSSPATADDANTHSSAAGSSYVSQAFLSLNKDSVSPSNECDVHAGDADVIKLDDKPAAKNSPNDVQVAAGKICV